MYNDKAGNSLSEKEHKFFERNLNCDLEDFKNFLFIKYDQLEKNNLSNSFNMSENKSFATTGSLSTEKYYEYNVFQFHNTGIYDLFKEIKSMTVEACEYYGIDFDRHRFMVQGWFNIHYKEKGKLNWHDHPGMGAPFFHGYYCVNAEPSKTSYKLFGDDDKLVENINKNNKAILSETGHPHAMGDWDWDGPRITVAYDVVPLVNLHPLWEQHWIPLS